MVRHSRQQVSKCPDSTTNVVGALGSLQIKTATYLKQKLANHRDTRLNIVLIGHTAAGKSTLINSIFSISRDRMVDKALVKSDQLEGVGSYHALKTGPADLFHQIYFYDTMGFTSKLGDDDIGISNNDLKAVCEGRVPVGHKFNAESVLTEPIKENKPHCVIFVVSAQVIDELSPELDLTIRAKLESLHKVVPRDVARLAVMTKIDRVCDDTFEDIQHIYSSKKVHTLVKKAEKTLGVQENRVFPIVNLVSQVEVDEKMSVPILYALKSALDFAKDRAEDNEDGE